MVIILLVKNKLRPFSTVMLQEAFGFSYSWRANNPPRLSALPGPACRVLEGHLSLSLLGTV